jgi:YD repeat-containing protein
MSLGHGASRAFLVSLVLGLSACGGDGDGGEASASSAKQPAAAPVPAATQLNARLTPFIGMWLACLSGTNNTSVGEEVTVVAGNGADRLAFDRTARLYSGSRDCSGPDRKIEEEKSELLWSGQTIVVQGLPLEKTSRTGSITRYTYDANGVLTGTPRSDPPPSLSAAVLSGAGGGIMYVGDESNLDPQGNPVGLLLYGRP